MNGGAIRNKEYAAVTAATPVDVDLLLGSGAAFKLIDVVFNLSTAATTSEDITIKTITPGGNTVTEYTFDPSTSSDTSHVFRFDKDFMAGTTIAIDFPNSDANTTVIVRYQENARA